MAKSTNKKDDKIVDVAKPGESTPDASSRPVIVGHRTLLQDPMVNPSKEDKKADDVPVSTTAPMVKPIDDQEANKPKEKAEKKPESKSVAVVVEEESSDEEKTAPLTEPKAKAEATTDEPEKKEEPAEEPAEDTEKATAEPAGDTEKDPEPAGGDVGTDQVAKKTSDKAEKEAAAKQEAIDKLITDKTYYLPIGEAKRKRNMSLVVILVLLLVILVVGYLAIDAGVIKTSIKLPVHLLSSN